MHKKDKTFYILFLLSLVFLCSCRVWKSSAGEGVVYFIDPSVSSNAFKDGSQSHPFSSWNDISKNNLWKPGGMYLQKCGTVFNGSLIFHGLVSGTPDQPVIIGAYGKGERPKIVSSGRYTLSLRDCSFWQIQDLDFSGAINKIVLVYAQNEDVHDIKISNCHIDGSSLIKKSGFHCVQIKNEKGINDIHHIYNIEISNNLIENAGGENLNCDGLNLTIQSNGHILHNIIQNNSGNGIDLAGGLGHIVENNKLLNNAGTKAHGPSYPLVNVVVRYNLIFQQNASNYNAFGFSLQDSHGGLFYNNTVYLNDHGMGALILKSPNNPDVYSSNVIVNNVFYGSRRGAATLRVTKEMTEIYDKKGNIINNNIIGKTKGSHFVAIHMDGDKRNNKYIDDDNKSKWILKHPQDVFENPEKVDPENCTIRYSKNGNANKLKASSLMVKDQEAFPGSVGANILELNKIKFDPTL